MSNPLSNYSLVPRPVSIVPNDYILVDFGNPDLNFKVHTPALTSTKTIKCLIGDALLGDDLNNGSPGYYVTSSVIYSPSGVYQPLADDASLTIPEDTHSIKVMRRNPKTNQRTEEDRRLWEPTAPERTTAYYLCKAIYTNPLESLRSAYSRHDIDEIQVADGGDCMLGVSHESKTIWIVFRGTKTAQDFQTDLGVHPENLGGGQVHGGFYQKLESLIHFSAAKYLLDRNAGYCIRFTGHSLGAACAQIFTLQALLNCELCTGFSKVGKSQGKRPKLASIAFATPFWACETLQNQVVNKKWESLFCTVLNDGDCVPALTNLGGPLIQNLKTHAEVIGNMLRLLKDLEIPLVSNLASLPDTTVSIFRGWLETNRGIANIKECKLYHPLGVYEYLRKSNDRLSKGKTEVELLYSTNPDLTENLVANSTVNFQSLNAHSLESFKASLTETNLISKTKTRSSDSGNIKEICDLGPRVEMVEGRKTYSVDGNVLNCMDLVVEGQFVSPPVKDKCSIDGLLGAKGSGHVEVADASSFKWKIDEGLTEIQHLTLKVRTPWGSSVYELDAQSLKSNASMTRRQLFHGDLVERVFVAAFGKSLLTESAAKTSSIPAGPLRTSLLRLEEEAKRAIGSRSEWEYSFKKAFDRARLDSNGDSEAATENARSVLEEAGQCAETVCQVLAERLELTLSSDKTWKIAGSFIGVVLITAGIIGVGYFVPPLFGMGAAMGTGAAGLGAGAGGASAVLGGAAIRFGLRPTRTDWSQLQQSYREILKMIAANLGCNLNEIDTDKEYLLEKEIERLVKKKQKSKGATELDAEHLLSDPHRSAPITIKDTTANSKESVMARLRMALQVYRIRNLMIDSTSISIMGPHNVGKTHFLNLLIENCNAACGSHLDCRTTLLTSYELCDNVFVFDTPGSTDPSQAARELCNFGLYSGIVLLLFRARSVDERCLDLLERAKVMKSLGATLLVYITCIDEEKNLTEAGMKRHRQDYANRLEMEGSEIKLVSFTNNNSPDGSFSRERSERLRSLGVLDGAGAVEDLFDSLKNCSQLSRERRRTLRKIRRKVVERVKSQVPS